MTGAGLARLFAWAFLVLIVLWLLAECLGGPNDRTDPGDGDDHDAEAYAEDCQTAAHALDLVGEADHDNVSEVVDQIEEAAADIRDPELSSMAYSFAPRAEELVADTEPGDRERLERTYRLYRGLVEVDLSLRCAGAGFD